LLPIKVAVDQHRMPGQFILTGSADILMLPQVSESLTGRIEILPLYPFSESERSGMEDNFPDRLYSSTALKSFMSIAATPTAQDLMQGVIKGGYPEMMRRDSAMRQRAWFNAYIKTLIERDIKAFAQIEQSTDMFRLLALLAAYSGGLSHYADLSRVLEMPQTTLKRYISILRATYLVHIIPAWCSNFGKRVIRSPKWILNDTGLISHLLGINLKRLEQDPMLYGRVFECFVILELIKQCSWSQTGAQYYHFRTTAGQEVDLVLEYPGGEIVGIEIKARATVSMQDVKWLKVLQEFTGERFLYGIVLYTGDQVIPFGDKLFSVPVHMLWVWSSAIT
jgi:hypothetical protein